MYDINYLRSLHSDATRRRGALILPLLLTIGLFLYSVDVVSVLRLAGKAERLEAEMFGRAKGLDQRETEARSALDDMIRHVGRRAGRIVWKPVFLALADATPEGHSLESVAYVGEKFLLTIEARGAVGGRPEFVESLRSDTLFTRSFPSIRVVDSKSGGTYRIVCTREEKE